MTEGRNSTTEDTTLPAKLKEEDQEALPTPMQASPPILGFDLQALLLVIQTSGSPTTEEKILGGERARPLQ